MNTVERTAADEAIVEALALGFYLVRINDKGESFLSRWAYEIADGLYRATHGDIEFGPDNTAPDGMVIGKYAALEEQADERVFELLREMAGLNLDA